MTPLELVRKQMDDAMAEFRSQLDWYDYIFITKSEYFYSQGIVIDANLEARKWWIVLKEIK